MNSTSATPISQATPKMNVETARHLLDQALETEKKDHATEMAQKRAVNAYTGASAFVPPAVIVSEGTEFPKNEGAH